MYVTRGSTTLPRPEASLTSTGLTDAEWTLMRSSSGLEILGVGIVAIL